MNKKPPELPNIEDATLRACLAPLMNAMNAGGEVTNDAPSPEAAVHALSHKAAAHASRPYRAASGFLAGSPAGSNDNPHPVLDTIGPTEHEQPGVPKTLAEWRSLADDDFGVFRMIEQFFAMTDAELLIVAADFPKQVGGTVARFTRIKRRLAEQYDTVTTAVALLERAMVRAAGNSRDE